MKQLFFFFAILFSSLSFSQSINDYKYAIIPDKFDFLKNNNEYNLNFLTKSYFEKIGFQAFLESDNLPMEAMDKCNAVYISAQQNNSMFVTKVKIAIKDCKGTVLVTSEEANTREKDYSVAYNEVFRKALTSFDKLNYKYAEKVISKVSTEKSIQKIEVPVAGDRINALVLTCHAQKTTNGFTLFDGKEGTRLFKIYETSNPNVFLVILNCFNNSEFKV